VIETDPVTTRNRIRRLRRYVADNLLDQGDFVCSAYGACSSSCKPDDAFREGTMSHVGRRFDLRMDGKSLRIVVVAQESGWPKYPKLAHLTSRVSLEDRYQQIHDGTGLGRRYYTEPGHAGRNPHMRGTTSALRVIFGKELGTDHRDEFVRPAHGKPFHLFDGFALVNRLLCSAGPPQSSQGRPTRQMLMNCGTHFAATMSILEPTLVIVQGKAVARGVRDLLTPEREHTEYLYEARINGGRAFLCSFSHPSAHGSLRWGDRLDSPYLTQVVVPTLTQAISLM
jgi:hypothetical protein